jgi:hypothetical protein
MGACRCCAGTCAGNRCVEMAIAGQVLLGMMTLTEILSSARWASLNSMRLNTTVPRSMFHKRVIKDSLIAGRLRIVPTSILSRPGPLFSITARMEMAIAGQVLLGMMTLTEILSSARWARTWGVTSLDFGCDGCL